MTPIEMFGAEFFLVFLVIRCVGYLHDCDVDLRRFATSETGNASGKQTGRENALSPRVARSNAGHRKPAWSFQHTP